MKIRPGLVVTARPWRSGIELNDQRAIVVVSTWSRNPLFALVWFPRLGRADLGPTVMAIRLDRITDARTYENEPRDWITETHLAADRAMAEGLWRPEWDLAAVALRHAWQSLGIR